MCVCVCVYIYAVYYMSKIRPEASVVGVMKVGNTMPRAGLEPTSHAYIYVCLYTVKKLSKWTDYGTDFKWSIQGAGRFRN